jgi:polyisoprenoid-binding protein YceI
MAGTRRAGGGCRAVYLGVLGALSCATAARAHHLDGANTQVSFEVGELGLRLFSAAFHELHGEFTLSPEPGAAHLTVVVAMASLSSRSPAWDQRLRSADWLDAARFPQMSYRSLAVQLEGGGRARIEGELTLHGITRPLALAITDIDCPAATGGALECRFLGRGHLRRSDFGLPHGFFQGGDEVTIVVRGQ